MRRAALAIGAVVGILASMHPGLATQTHPGAVCARPSVEPGLGLACPTPFGYQVLLADGTSVFTHGLDPVLGHLGPTDDFPKAAPKCVTNPGEEFHGHIIYARAADKPNRYSSRLTDIRTIVKQINGKLRDEASEFNRRVDLRVLCSRGDPVVTHVELPTPFAQTDFATIVGDLRAAGYASLLAKYWIWFDGKPPNAGAAGVGTVLPDDRPTPENPNNLGSHYAVAFGQSSTQGGAGVWMHEIGHTMGAVQGYSSPNGSGGSNGQGGGMHCNDGLDIMCYPDGGALSNYRSTTCRDALHFDCNHNDYFNPNPKKGSYLATHWNLGSPFNRFVSGCSYRTGVLTAGNGSGVSGVDVDDAIAEATGSWDAVSARTYSVPTSCRGRKFGLSAVPAVPDEYAGPVGTATSDYLAYSAFMLTLPRVPALPVPDVNVCFYEGSKLLRCATEAGADSGTVPSKATKARILLNAGAQALYTFNIV